jgi:hypothetical protein
MLAMSKIIIVKEGQSLMDVAVQHCGNIDAMMDIMEANVMINETDPTGFEFDCGDKLLKGLKLTIEDEWIDKKITNELTQNISTAV